jgi:hypothetical protein
MGLEGEGRSKESGGETSEEESENLDGLNTIPEEQESQISVHSQH